MKMRNMAIMHRKYLALEQYHCNYNEAPLVHGLAADGMISVGRDNWTILNKYTGFITYIGVVSTVSPRYKRLSKE